jgi:hypothetical protein
MPNVVMFHNSSRLVVNWLRNKLEMGLGLSLAKERKKEEERKTSWG